MTLETRGHAAAVCLHMLELCAAKSRGHDVLQQESLDTLKRWKLAGGCATGQVCRCGSEITEKDGEVNITVENVSERWWPVDFNWLDA